MHAVQSLLIVLMVTLLCNNQSILLNIDVNTKLNLLNIVCNYVMGVSFMHITIPLTGLNDGALEKLI